jgi:ornithine carbamoyltransferase
MMSAYPHSDIPPFGTKELAKYSPVPVLNALSSLWHPTQTLADLLTLHEHAHLFEPSAAPPGPTAKGRTAALPKLRPLTIAYVGDSANVLHDMLVTYPRLGHSLRVATPSNPAYQAPTAVWDRVKELKCDEKIWWGTDPKEAVKGADVVATDTWSVRLRQSVWVNTDDNAAYFIRVSMGQEAEYEQRVRDFAGYQVTEALCREGGAHPDWKFIHCLPRKKHEVDDEVRPFENHSCFFTSKHNLSSPGGLLWPSLSRVPRS